MLLAHALVSFGAYEQFHAAGHTVTPWTADFRQVAPFPAADVRRSFSATRDCSGVSRRASVRLHIDDDGTHSVPVESKKQIGMGGRVCLAKFYDRHVPEATITVAEIDPHVIWNAPITCARTPNCRTASWFAPPFRPVHEVSAMYRGGSPSSASHPVETKFEDS